MNKDVNYVKYQVIHCFTLFLSIFLPSSLFPAIAVVLAVWEVGGGEGV